LELLYQLALDQAGLAGTPDLTTTAACAKNASSQINSESAAKFYRQLLAQYSRFRASIPPSPLFKRSRPAAYGEDDTQIRQFSGRSEASSFGSRLRSRASARFRLTFSLGKTNWKAFPP
jgi:hypothetical protein